MEAMWTPSEDFLRDSNAARLMRRHGIPDYFELVRRSNRDIRWFWESCFEDLGITWQRPYSELLDASRGFAWASWFVGGKNNLVAHCLDRHLAEGRGEQTAFRWEGEDGETRAFTYRELNADVGRLAAVLRRDCGVGVGDRVGLYLPMIPEMVVSFFACLKIGAVVVPVFSGFGPEALSVRMNHAEAKCLITADASLRRGKTVPIKATADLALPQIPSIEKVLVVDRLGTSVSWQEGRDLDWKKSLSAAVPDLATEVLDAEAPSLILYTSGTTGLPKGTVHTHAGCLAQMSKELAYYFDVKSGDVFFWLTDIGWMMGPWEMIGCASLGATFVIYEGAPDYPEPDRLWQMLARHRVTHFGTSPTAIRLVMKHGDEWVKKHDLSRLRILGSTGEPWDPESYRWFFEKIGGERCPVINISGGTEIVGCLLAPAPVIPLKSCTLGQPGLGMDVDVFDESGHSLRGEVGYLVCKQPAPSMTKGFWRDTERYEETYFSKWPEIWFHGDWAKVDEDGFWFLHGRADDTIKVSGRRTGPAEIEAAILRHPACSEAAAIGVPHAIKGEGIVAFVVLKPEMQASSELAKELIELVGEVLGKTLRPEAVHFVASLPKTRSAKIVRRAIKAKYLGRPLGDLSTVENPDSLTGITAI